VTTVLSLTTEDLLGIAERMDPNFRSVDPPSEVLSALETVRRHGGAEMETGDNDLYTAHYYLVDRWVVSRGWDGTKSYREFDTTTEAYEQFAELDDDYVAWRAAGP
jgi:hypothetical protein